MDVDKDMQRDNIYTASEGLAKAIKKTVGSESRVGIFYIYLDKDEWVSGDAGNMNWIERVGAINYLKKLEEGGIGDEIEGNEKYKLN